MWSRLTNEKQADKTKMPEYSRIKGRKTKQNKTEAGTEEST